MKRTLLISAVLFTLACGHNSQSNDTTNSAAASRPGSGAGAATGGPAGTASNLSSQAVTLVGCLQGPAQAGTHRHSRVDGGRSGAGARDGQRRGG